jgi:L-aspartate oxidase
LHFRDYVRRYLTQFDTLEVPQRITEVLVIGSGIAGLRAADEASKSAKVLVLAKGALGETATRYAQGGVAIAADADDSVESHVADTIATGKGLCDKEAVETIISEGPAALRDLMDWGFFFDTANGKYDFGKEGGHSKPRILRAHGDETGQALQNLMLKRVEASPSIRTQANTFVVDLLTDEGVCRGALVWNEQRGMEIIWAGAVVLASGGSGRVFRETTNPPIATADGIAMAYRAGAELADLEFFQFHPTTLYIAGASRALISEALRGEGAILRTRGGRAFMKDYHPSAELAPRDVVSRAIISELKKTGTTNVYLDFSHMRDKHIKERFGHLAQLCESFDLDLYEDPIPVRPTAHYQIGGVRTDLQGRTTVERLFACGEVASTGIHGANRLASNSLLEGLVMGKRAGVSALKAAQAAARDGQVIPKFMEISFEKYRQHHIVLEDMIASLRSLMWRFCGVERDGKELKAALDEVSFWSRYVLDREFHRPEGWELQNMLIASVLSIECALKRTESRGVHFRNDFPKTDDLKWKKHTIIRWEGRNGK